MLEELDIREAWPTIRPGLARLEDRFEPDWRGEDVYHACRAGEAHCFANVLSGEFVILTPRTNEYTLEKELFVWIAWSPDPLAQDKYLDQLEDIARGIGAVKLIMRSPRRGFLRSRNWTPRFTEFERDLTDERT